MEIASVLSQQFKPLAKVQRLAGTMEFLECLGEKSVSSRLPADEFNVVSLKTNSAIE